MRTAAAPRWVDFHCHLDLYPEHRALIQRCDAEQIATLAVTTTPKAYPRNVEMAARSPFVMVALGLHPQLVAERAGEFRLFEKFLSAARFVGEIGLDAGPKFYASFAEQQRLFAHILRACDEQPGKILTIHSVRCVSKVLAQLESNLRSQVTIPVMHWFAGTQSEVKRATELGCYFSVNTEMLASPRGRAIVEKLPIKRVLTETDGPFVLVDKRPAQPTDIPDTVSALAALRGFSSEAMAQQICTNFRQLVSGRSS